MTPTFGNTKLFLHSIKKNIKYEGDVVVVRESELIGDTIKPNLSYIVNPNRSFYITKPEFRNHKYKKERCHISQLDKFKCKNYELINRLYESLQHLDPSSNVDPSIQEYQQYQMRKKEDFNLDYLCKSPYVYGADIGIEALIKANYIDKFGLDKIHITTGFLDIETSTITKTIIIISVTHENKVYTAVRKDHMFEKDEKGNMKPFTIDDVIIENRIQIDQNEEIKKHIKKHNFTFEYFVGETEIELVEWIFSKIFLNKTDFIGIWNMNFDIPQIIKAIKRCNKQEINVMSHPDVPFKYRYLRYKEDINSKPSHYTLKWHWLYLAGYTQFLDSMGLYSQVRKTQKFEDSYALEDILMSNLKFGKLKIPHADNHYIMQTQFFKQYIVYNQIDAIGIQLLEWKNEDISSMIIQAGITPVSEFGYKTVTTTNSLYHKWRKKDYIIASKSSHDPLIGLRI